MRSGQRLSEGARLFLVRPVALVALALVGYAVLPVHAASATVAAVGTFAAGIALFAWLVSRQARRIRSSPRPALAAVEAVSVVVTMFVLAFALTYVALSTSDPASFNQPIDKVTGLYFTVTVLSTVGFGDVFAVSHLAKLAVVVQIVANLAILGTVVRIMVDLARAGAAPPPPSDPR